MSECDGKDPAAMCIGCLYIPFVFCFVKVNGAKPVKSGMLQEKNGFVGKCAKESSLGTFSAKDSNEGPVWKAYVPSGE